MEKNLSLKSLPKDVLAIAEQLSKELQEASIKLCWVHNLGGLCSYSAYELTRRLKAAGHNALFIQGGYGAFQEDHCWAQLDDYIIDLTARQFNHQEPYILVVKAVDHRFQIEHVGKAASRVVTDTWYGNDHSWKRAFYGGRCRLT